MCIMARYGLCIDVSTYSQGRFAVLVANLCMYILATLDISKRHFTYCTLLARFSASVLYASVHVIRRYNRRLVHSVAITIAALNNFVRF